jgi:hypothetical protein
MNDSLNDTTPSTPEIPDLLKLYGTIYWDLIHVHIYRVAASWWFIQMIYSNDRWGVPMV